MILKIVGCPVWERGDVCREGRYGGLPSPAVCSLVCDVHAAVTEIEVEDPPPATWQELHLRALSFEGDVDAELKWLSDYARRVPSEGCSCKSDWREWYVANPPDLADADTYWHWSYLAHRAVSERIGKDVPDEATALAYWRSVAAG